jgi:hypothetical protein
MIRVQLYAGTEKKGISKKTNQAYSFFEYDVQADNGPGKPPTVAKISTDEVLAPGMYDIPCYTATGEFKRLEARFGKPVAVAAASK